MKEWPELYEELGHAPEIRPVAASIAYELRSNGANCDLVEVMDRVAKGELELDFNTLMRSLVWSGTARQLLPNDGWTTIYNIITPAIVQHNQNAKPPKGNRQITDHIYGL